MTKRKVFSAITIIALTVCGYSCGQISPKKEKQTESSKDLKEDKFSPVRKLSEFKETEFIPTLEHRIGQQNNAVYCATLLYVWDEVRKVTGKSLNIPAVHKDLQMLDNSKTFLNVLKPHEYSASAVFDGYRITARAEFGKSLPFENILDSYDGELVFKGQKVASFGVTGYSLYKKRSVVEIVYYKNDNNYIIKLLPKDRQHEILLFKSEKQFSTMDEMTLELTKLSEVGQKESNIEKAHWRYVLNNEDEVMIPKFNFNIETDYATLEGNTFGSGIQTFTIVKAWQRTALILNENGAEIESEAEAVVEEPIEEDDKPKPKKMYFDKPFLIVLKRTDATNPYFGLWVANTELMIRE